MMGLPEDSVEGKRGYICGEKIKIQFGVYDYYDTNPLSMVPRGAI